MEKWATVGDSSKMPVRSSERQLPGDGIPECVRNGRSISPQNLNV